MGANSSSHVLAIGVLSLAILYVAWRHNQTQNELRALRALVDTSVSLHELEEQVMPAIDSLEQEAARLKREMQQMARKASTQSPLAKPPGKEMKLADKEAQERQLDLSDDDGDSAQESVDDESPAPAADDFPLLLGMGQCMAPPVPKIGTVGVPVTRVVIQSNERRELFPAVPPAQRMVEVVSDEEAEDDSAADGGSKPATRRAEVLSTA